MNSVSSCESTIVRLLPLARAGTALRTYVVVGEVMFLPPVDYCAVLALVEDALAVFALCRLLAAPGQADKMDALLSCSVRYKLTPLQRACWLELLESKHDEACGELCGQRLQCERLCELDVEDAQIRKLLLRRALVELRDDVPYRMVPGELWSENPRTVPANHVEIGLGLVDWWDLCRLLSVAHVDRENGDIEWQYRNDRLGRLLLEDSVAVDRAFELLRANLSADRFAALLRLFERVVVVSNSDVVRAAIADLERARARLEVITSRADFCSSDDVRLLRELPRLASKLSEALSGSAA
jgi:hypothetical protein